MLQRKGTCDYVKISRAEISTAGAERQRATECRHPLLETMQKYTPFAPFCLSFLSSFPRDTDNTKYVICSLPTMLAGCDHYTVKPKIFNIRI